MRIRPEQTKRNLVGNRNHLQEEPGTTCLRSSISCLPSVIEDALQDNEIRTFETLPFSRFSLFTKLRESQS